MRFVICHYHIYKNSGTSFDELLSRNYGERHICFDGPFPFFSIDQKELTHIVERKSDIVAFSSHQIRLPVPSSLKFVVLPVVFIRHPLLRIKSIYNFKRKAYDGTSTSQAAREMSFNEWIGYCFQEAQEIVHVSNAQTRMLGAAHREKALMRKTSSGMEYDLYQAIRNLRNVQLLARTECFSADVSRFPGILEGYGINFEFEDIAPRNITSRDYGRPVSERLDEFQKILSEENYERLLGANMQDLALFDYVSTVIDGC